MITTKMASAAMIALAFTALNVTGIATEVVDETPSRYIIGFFDMPANQSSYGGDDVVKVDDDLVYFVVETTDYVGLQARAALDTNVRYVESDVSDHQLHYTPNDYFYTHASNWGVGKIGAEQAWDRTLGSSSIKDVHLDSGIVANHEDLQGSRFLSGWDYYNNDGTPEDESACSYHGTHTAGTVAATINNGLGFAGMAQITVDMRKIFDGAGCWAASTSAMADALKSAGDNGGHVSSNSWGGGGYSQTLHDAITYSTNLGTIFVASSGNSACSNCVGNPWVQQAGNTIIVTATDSNDNGASFNSKGPQVDVSAPGVYIGSANGPNSNSYVIMDGTSMAAPHVAGLVGLIKTLNPSWTRAQVTDQITSTAVDLGASGHDDTFGHGRIDADAATAGGSPPAAACDDGIDNDGDGLTDFPADPGCTSASDDDEYNAPPGGDSVHTHDLDIWKSGKYRYLKIWAFDNGEAAESGVDVSILATHGSHSASGTAATGGDGSVTFSWRHGGGSYTLCVTDMVKSGFTWDSAAGHASAGNCHTEST